MGRGDSDDRQSSALGASLVSSGTDECCFLLLPVSTCWREPAASLHLHGSDQAY